MSAPKDGGSAFPGMKPAYQLQSGMSLRDWFAGMALQGYFAAPNTPHQCRCDYVADYVYEMADAMLAAREGKEEGQ